jgi:prepilin-type N-terminal cleavage/methylation domain-containing protein
MFKHRLKSNKSGFTLIELMVTIVIIGILASIAMFYLKPAMFFGKGRDARRQSDLESVRSAMEQYYLDNGRLYPNTDYTGLQTPLSSYINHFPTDPNSGTYTYTYSTDRKCYQLGATLEVATPTNYKVCGGSLACQSANSFVCP